MYCWTEAAHLLKLNKINKTFGAVRSVFMSGRLQTMTECTMWLRTYLYYSAAWLDCGECNWIIRCTRVNEMSIVHYSTSLASEIFRTHSK